MRNFKSKWPELLKQGLFYHGVSIVLGIGFIDLV